MKKGPYSARGKKGYEMLICHPGCGLSGGMPYCDNTHVVEGFKTEPVIYTFKKTGTVQFCGCGQSKTFPICDGTHETLPDE